MWGSDVFDGLVRGFVPAYMAALVVMHLSGDTILGVHPDLVREVGLGFLTIPGIRAVVWTLLLVGPSYLLFTNTAPVIRQALDTRADLNRKNALMLVSITRSPAIVYWEGNVSKHGVTWACVFGRHRDDEYAQIEGPYCPNCDTGMLRRPEVKWVFFEKQVWRCPRCGNVVERPEETLFEEKEDIEAVCESIVDRAAEADDPEEYLAEMDGVVTFRWNPPRSDTRMGKRCSGNGRSPLQ